MNDKSIQEEIFGELEGRTKKYVRAMQTETGQYPEFVFVQQILKYLDKKNVRICRLPEVYGLVEHERLVEE